jgi:hypothetical protein
MLAHRNKENRYHATGQGQDAESEQALNELFDELAEEERKEKYGEKTPTRPQ